MYNLDDYFGVNSDELQAVTIASSESPTPTGFAGHPTTGPEGVVNSLTDWRRSPVFWLAVFAVFALGVIHLEGHIGAALEV